MAKGVDLFDHNLHLFNDHILPVYGRVGATPDVMKSQCKEWNSTMTRGLSAIATMDWWMSEEETTPQLTQAY
jgi:hypothetical protein